MADTPTADLELAFWERDPTHYGIELRCLIPGNEADVRKGSEKPVEIAWEGLRELHAEPGRYGALLTESVFSDPSVRTSFLEAIAATEAQGHSPLRLKL